jgi:hypothetical protein
MSQMDRNRSVAGYERVGTTSIQRATERGNLWDRDWLNPLSMSVLKRAVGRKDKAVVLNGHQFDIEYGHSFPSKLVTDHDGACIKLKRSDGSYAPFGYVSLARINRFNFES